MVTQKGTELPLLNLKGKDYLEVKYRILWMREERPLWSIETEPISLAEESALFKATIKDDAGKILATSHKFETLSGFPDFIEKAETGAIGRALALCGYGTQFCADDLDEGQRIVDAPCVPKDKKPTTTIPNGSVYTEKTKWPYPYPEGFKGKLIEDMASDELAMCHGNLMAWKKGKNASTFPKNGNSQISYIESLMNRSRQNGATK